MYGVLSSLRSSGAPTRVDEPSSGTVKYVLQDSLSRGAPPSTPRPGGKPSLRIQTSTLSSPPTLQRTSRRDVRDDSKGRSDSGVDSGSKSAGSSDQSLVTASGPVGSAFRQLLRYGNADQKALITSYDTMLKLLAASMNASPAEMKYYQFSGLMQTHNTTQVYSAANYRFPIHDVFLSIADGTTVQQRVGSYIRLKHIEVMVKIIPCQLFQNATSPIYCRSYPVKIGLWRQKINANALGAMTIATSVGQPISGAEFYWDEYDTAIRTGGSTSQDSALMAPHNPHPLAKANNHCIGEKTWHPWAPDSSTHANAGVCDTWQSQSGDHFQTGIFKFNKSYGKGGLKVGFSTNATAPPVINNHVLTLITDKPPAATTVTQLEYYYSVFSRVWFTDA